MGEKTFKFNNIKVNKKEFHKSKQAIDLDSIITDKIVISDKFRHNEENFKCFIDYQEDEMIKPLCIILPQANSYIKYFENGGKNMSFLIKNDEEREFNGDIQTNVLGNGLPKENMYYACIACIAVDSVFKMSKKNYPQVYLEECKYKVKKIHTPIFINIELETNSESNAETDSGSNTTTEN